MANTHTTLIELFGDIADAIRAKTGGSANIKADEFPSAIASIPTDSGGITPVGSINITENGTYDVTEKATAAVNVPDSGITPSGTKSITENGEYDVTAYANANVQIAGLNARVLTATIASDASATGYVTFVSKNEYLKALRNNPNAFVLVRYLGTKPSTPMMHLWLTANFDLYYYGANASKALLIRSTASASSVTNSTQGLSGDDYTAHVYITSDGTLRLYLNAATYPVLAGDYQIIAGTVEML